MADSSSGPRFGRYRLRGRVAMGGMGEVYKATAQGFDGVEKVVAIKLIKDSLASEPDLVKMFVEEAKVAFLLSHANVVQTFDVGTINGQYFIAMEYVEGRTLARLLRSCREALGQLLPQRHGIYVIVEALKGLSHAHRAKDANGRALGIVHRDVSPSNILVSRDGEVKVSDFGIAWSTMKSNKSELGAIKGKVPYMPPEQVRGGALDGRTDVYAVGAVLFEVLTGRPPFVGPVGALIPLVVDGRFPRPRELNPDIPSELEALVLRAMALSPEGRFESAIAMRDALEELAMRRAWRLSSTDLAAFADAVDAEPRIETPAAEDAFDVALGAELCKVDDADDAAGVSVFTSALRSPSAPPRGSVPSPEHPTVDTTPDVPLQAPAGLAPVALSPSPAERRTPSPSPAERERGWGEGPAETPALPTRRRGRVVAFYGVAAVVVAVAAALAARAGSSDDPLATGEEIEVPPAPTVPASAAQPPPRPATTPTEPPAPGLPVGMPLPAVAPVAAPPDVAPLPPVTPAATNTDPGAVLQLNTEPWTQVEIDGVRVGPTPIIGRRLRAGRHQLVLTNPARGIHRSLAIVLREGERKRIVLDLTAGDAP